jgi:hypothetical protein
MLLTSLSQGAEVIGSLFCSPCLVSWQSDWLGCKNCFGVTTAKCI